MSSLTPSNPVTALVNLSVDAIALVDEGANSRAHILLTKRKENTQMTFEELIKALNPEQAELVTKHIAGLTAAKDATVAELTEKVKTLSDTVDELQKKTPPQQTEEDITKNASPELKEYVETLQKTVAGLVATQEENIAAARYAKVKALPVEEAALKDVLKSASPAVFEILEKASQALEKGLTAKGKATSGEPEEDPYDKLTKAAQAIMKADSELTFEQAFTKACEKDAKTYQEYVKGVK